MSSGAADTAGPQTGEALLSVRNLRTEIETEDGTLVAVDGISFDLFAGEVLAVVGESGCGKTMLALSILGLLPGPSASTTAGEVRLAGEDLLAAPPLRRRQARGAEIAMIFQDPLTALNPVHRVGDQIAEMLRAHRPLRKRYARLRAEDLLERVGIPDADRRARCYPHELSGGMRQRVMIAMAVALDPVVLIADEPTTALDATVQAQVLEVPVGGQRAHVGRHDDHHPRSRGGRGRGRPGDGDVRRPLRGARRRARRVPPATPSVHGRPARSRAPAGPDRGQAHAHLGLAAGADRRR